MDLNEELEIAKNRVEELEKQIKGNNVCKRREIIGASLGKFLKTLSDVGDVYYIYASKIESDLVIGNWISPTERYIEKSVKCDAWDLLDDECSCVEIIDKEDVRKQLYAKVDEFLDEIES